MWIKVHQGRKIEFTGNGRHLSHCENKFNVCHDSQRSFWTSDWTTYDDVTRVVMVWARLRPSAVLSGLSLGRVRSVRDPVNCDDRLHVDVWSESEPQHVGSLEQSGRASTVYELLIWPPVSLPARLKTPLSQMN